MFPSFIFFHSSIFLFFLYFYIMHLNRNALWFLLVNTLCAVQIISFLNFQWEKVVTLTSSLAIICVVSPICIVTNEWQTEEAKKNDYGGLIYDDFMTFQLFVSFFAALNSAHFIVSIGCTASVYWCSIRKKIDELAACACCTICKMEERVNNWYDRIKEFLCGITTA